MAVNYSESKELTMKEFYDRFGLNNYPFNVYTAENESDFANEIFVHPTNYDAIKNSYDGKRSIVIRGNRGTGKTALLKDLILNNSSSDGLLCQIDDYSDMNLLPQNSEYYLLLITNLVTTLFHRLFDDPKRIQKLSKEDKLFLSLLLTDYTSQITKSELTRKIESIQHSALTRFLKKNINLVRAILNYGITAGLNVWNDVIRSYFGRLPMINESQIKDIIPEINFETETEFNKSKASYNLLLRVCSLISKLGYSKTVVFFDKFDEDYRMENNAETISSFIKPLLTDNKLLENTSIQIIISVWEVPFNRLLTQFRSQKHYCPLLSWPVSKLQDALNKRLQVFSSGAVNNFREMFDSNVSNESIDEIFSLSNGNPRDLWHIFDHIFRAQYSHNPNCVKLSKEAVDIGLSNFVTSFNFYEYYPRRPNAKANSMDIYSYIKHLLKLPKDTFTKNLLNESAKTGSSTSNYVIGMEAIGLIVNTNEKDQGGIVYKINDPKVVYAMTHNLDISRR